MYGYTPKNNYIGRLLNIDNLDEILTEEIKFEMKNGIQKVLPSFIGELVITDVTDHF